MAIEGTFYMDITDGLVGDKLYGGTAEWDDSLSEQNNIYRAMGYDPISGSVNWDYTNMPTFQSLIPTALQNASDVAWQTLGGQQATRYYIGNTISSEMYLSLSTSSWNMPVENNWNYPTVGYGAYWYTLRLSYPGASATVFNDSAFAMQEGKTILGYDVQHTTPLLSFDETNGYQGFDPDEHHNRYYSNPNLSPNGLLLFYEVIDDENVPTKLYYVSVRNQMNLEGTPTLFYRLMSDEILSYVNMEEQEEEDMKFPNSKIKNMFTTMYALTPAEVEAMAEDLTNRSDRYVKPTPTVASGMGVTFFNKILDDMGFSTGVVTDAIIDMTIYPFAVPTVCKTIKTNYIKLGYGSDKLPPSSGQLTDDDYNLGLFYYGTAIDRIDEINKHHDELTLPQSGSGINFDNQIVKFNDFRDYPPYRTFEMYVPYVGIVPVDQRKLYGKNIRVHYIVDFYSGNATALLEAVIGNNDYEVIEMWECIMGVHQAVATTNWVEYASRMNSAKAQVFRAGFTAPTSFAKDPFGTVTDIIDATRNQATTEGIYTGNVNGTNSSMGNYFMPQGWYIIDYKQETDITGNLSSLKGRASNTSGAISTFSGFLQVSDVDLICPQATDAEKAKIISMLESGVRI